MKKTAGSSSDKRRRLHEMRYRLPYASMTALAEFIKLVRAEGLPEVASRTTMYEAKADVLLAKTPYGPILQYVDLTLVDGSTLQNPIAHPLALLWTIARMNCAFTRHFMKCLKDFPPSLVKKWRLLLYSDEITPGDALQGVHKRKVWAVYYALLEFGLAALASELAWLHITALRSCKARDIDAGISRASLF